MNSGMITRETAKPKLCIYYSLERIRATMRKTEFAFVRSCEKY